MLSVIWFILIFISFVCGFFTGNLPDVVQNITFGAKEAITLIISLAGIMCFWSGIMEILIESKLIDVISKMFSPILKLIFKESFKDTTAKRYITSNFTANLLGLSNAATPMGLKASSRIYDLNNRKGVPKELILLIIINCSSVQLIPTTVAGLCALYGSSTPFDILPAVWITSFVSVSSGILLAKICEKVDKSL